jgi:arsenate reductase
MNDWTMGVVELVFSFGLVLGLIAIDLWRTNRSVMRDRRTTNVVAKNVITTTHTVNTNETSRTMNVLILCTHNSARSVLAEGMLNHLAQQRGQEVRAHSAGSQPGGRVNPFALEVLDRAGVDTTGFRSKSWDEFTTSESPPIAIVITVCDSAAAESCPVFFGGKGHPIKVHWGYPDPSTAEGDSDAKRRAFELTRQAIGFRMLQLLDVLKLPSAHLGEGGGFGADLADALQAIGRS